MKTSFTKKAFLTLLCCVTLLYTSDLKAQILQEVPNPADHQLNFFSGGGDGNLFFNYNDLNFNNKLFLYNQFNLSAVNLPAGAQFPSYSHSFDGKHYIFAYDINFNQNLYEYNGLGTTLFNLPPDLQFYFYVTSTEDHMYLVLADFNFINISLYRYDGTNFQELPNPPGMQFNNFVDGLDGNLYFSYYNNSNFAVSLYSLEGSTMTEVPGLPANSTFLFSAFNSDDQIFLGVQDFAFNTSLYTLDDTGLNAVPNPTGQLFSYIPGANEVLNEVYITYFSNVTFFNSLFAYYNGNLNQILAPPGYESPNFSNVHNGITFISMYDNINFQGTLARLNGLIPEIVNNPPGYTFSNYVGEANGAAYYIYYDQFFNNVLMKLDEVANTVSPVPGPPDHTFNFVVATVNDKLILSYYDTFFEQSLWIFDGTNFIQVPNPTDKEFGNLMTVDLDKIYLRYNNLSNFEGTLYVLTPNSLPTSIDNSVTTSINIPYFFSTDDFLFEDNDPNDELTEILITEVEQVGYLLMDGAHIYEGDIIPFDKIESITFTPLTDESGSPYDAFKFRVGDGEAFSAQSYTMVINVVDPTSVDGNLLNAFTTVYPVPAVNYTTLDIASESQLGELSIRIFSTSGKLVTQKQFDGIGNNFREDFDVSGLPAGSYFMVGNTAAGQFAKQILINR